MHISAGVLTSFSLGVRSMKCAWGKNTPGSAFCARSELSKFPRVHKKNELGTEIPFTKESIVETPRPQDINVPPCTTAAILPRSLCNCSLAAVFPRTKLANCDGCLIGLSCVRYTNMGGYTRPTFENYPLLSCRPRSNGRICVFSTSCCTRRGMGECVRYKVIGARLRTAANEHRASRIGEFFHYASALQA